MTPAPAATRRALDMPEWAAGGLCVLASGSAGNCSVLVVPEHHGPSSPRRVILIDAGLSPRRTARLLAERGIDPCEVDEVLLTHLDGDHLAPGWCGVARWNLWKVSFRVLKSHAARAAHAGIPRELVRVFDDRFDIGPSITVQPIVMSHDAQGVAAFRFTIRVGDDLAATLGFATDLGRATPGLIDHLRGVGTLAIESNYCPELQLSSGRPAFLKRRIMGGSGHLSNEECAEAVDGISPRDSLVLLHLSRQCNRPDLASSYHDHRDIDHTITDQHTPTGWVWLRTGPVSYAPDPALTQAPLFAERAVP